MYCHAANTSSATSISSHENDACLVSQTFMYMSAISSFFTIFGDADRSYDFLPSQFAAERAKRNGVEAPAFIELSRRKKIIFVVLPYRRDFPLATHFYGNSVREGCLSFLDHFCDNSV